MRAEIFVNVIRAANESVAAIELIVVVFELWRLLVVIGRKRREIRASQSDNGRVRRGMNQLAWRFLVYPKDSALKSRLAGTAAPADQGGGGRTGSIARRAISAFGNVARHQWHWAGVCRFPLVGSGRQLLDRG